MPHELLEPTPIAPESAPAVPAQAAALPTNAEAASDSASGPVSPAEDAALATTTEGAGEPEASLEPSPEVFDGVLSDLGPESPGSLTKSGPSTLILTADHRHTGGTMIAGGTLQLGQGGESGSVPGPITVHGRLVFDRSDEFAFAGQIAGAGRVRQAGPGLLRLTGRSAARGTLEIDGAGVALRGAWAGAFEILPARRLQLESGTIGAFGATSSIAPEGLAEGVGHLHGGLINYGTVCVDGAWNVLTVRGGPVTNAAGGTLRATRGAILNLSGATLLVNQGVIDRISGTILFPATFRNLGLVLDSSVVRVKSAARNGETVALSIESHTGHTYQLQRGRSLDPDSFVSLGKPKPGQTGRDLRFIDPFPEAQAGYYRVVVDP
ncbi:MAG: autotransporter-associated beta strand repeat-containing protein [Verrucomicrobia bacterium]|nr:autotransporter-associated beta strand repeat-containing protein [Verrucomicrobiota bacterium]